MTSSTKPEVHNSASSKTSQQLFMAYVSASSQHWNYTGVVRYEIQI